MLMIKLNKYMNLQRKILNKLNKIIKNNEAKKENIFRQNEYNKLLESYKTNEKVRLHFGCGPRVLKGWINIDLSFEPFEKYMKYYTDKFYPESIRGNINDFYGIDILKTGLPFPDNSVDLIFHEDFLEHLDQKEQIIFLAETYRVLKPGAIHRINTPNLISSMKEHSDFKKGKAGIYTDEWDKHIHKSVLTPDYLKEIAKLIGYNEIIFNNRDKSTASGLPLEYRPSGDRKETGNIFSDLIK